MAEAASTDSLLRANAGFYRAFEALDIAALESLWERSDRVFCVHPGWRAISGRDAVMASWRSIFANTGKIRFMLTRVQARVEGALGIVTLYENIQSTAGSEAHSAGAIATNLFGYDAAEGAWKLFHHHASLAMVPEESSVVN